MSRQRTYLDWNATTPLRPQARAAMLAALDVAGNPSSVHAEGRAARALVEAAREQVAALAGASPSEVVFTSGGTEANAWVLSADWDRVIVSEIEHPSVLVPAQARGPSSVRLIDTQREGAVDLGDLARALDHGKADRDLLSVQMANNETGVLQDVGAIASTGRERGAVVHTDAVQALGKVAVDFRALGVDYLSISAHKIGGPKGVGALIVRQGAALPALITGGGQERRRRGGTENVAGIAGFGAAAEAAGRQLEEFARLRALRDGLEREAKRLVPQAMIVAEQAPRLANTACIALPGHKAETLVIALDLAGVAVSAGAACSSGKVGPSHVLAAMGLEPAIASSAIRVSIGWETTERDVAAFLDAWAHVVARRGERAVA